MTIIPAVALALSVATMQIPQQADSSAIIPQPLFDSHEVLRMWLSYDRETVSDDIGRHLGDNEYEGQQEHSATVAYLSAEGDTVEVPVTVETRGHFRRDPDNCNFPPLRLDFDKAEFDDAPRQERRRAAGVHRDRRACSRAGAHEKAPALS